MECLPKSMPHLLRCICMASLVALLAIGSGTPRANGQYQDTDASEPGALDAELLRQVEEAARLEREYRSQQAEHAETTRSAEENARAAEVRAAAERERAAAAPYEAAISEQRALQGDLIWAATGRGERPRADVLAAPTAPSLEETDPRVAAAAPQGRELPRDIFDHESVEIEAGRFGNQEPIRAIRLVLDADGDGKPELIRWLRADSQSMIRQEEDRNYDGVLDAWSTYTQRGEIESRVLDSNDDGNPDVFERYRDGRLAARDLDRDDDAVRDVFYRYDGDSLADERHDANNDGIVDLIIVYSDRLRVRAEEDVDRDGRMDLWTTYVARDGVEQVVRIERDRHGKGYPDTFEIFETQDGQTVLLRREEDTNGDGQIDVVSFYVGGKLRRRQLIEPGTASM